MPSVECWVTGWNFGKSKANRVVEFPFRLLFVPSNHPLPERTGFDGDLSGGGGGWEEEPIGERHSGLVVIGFHRLLPQGKLCIRADTELLKEKLALLVEEGRAWGRRSRGERPGGPRSPSAMTTPRSTQTCF